VFTELLPRNGRCLLAYLAKSDRIMEENKSKFKIVYIREITAMDWLVKRGEQE
jgi:hypothetical protein